MLKPFIKTKNIELVNQAVGGSAWNLIASIIQRIGGFIFTVILARFLLPESFGLYNLTISIATIFFMFCQNGINATLRRYFSEVLNYHDKDKESGYFQYLLKIKLFVLFIALIILLIFAYPVSTIIFKNKSIFIPLLLAGCYMFIISLEQFFTAFFFSIGKVKYIAFKETIGQASRILIVLLMFLIIYSNPTIIATFISLILSIFVTLSFVIYKTYSISPYLFAKFTDINKTDKKRIINFSLYLTFASISLVFFGSTDILMLGWLVKDTSYVGFYSSAFVLISSLSGLLTFAHVLLPVFVKTGKDNLEKVFNKTFRYSIILSMPASFGFIILADYIINLIYGQNYAPAVFPLYFLSFLVVLSIQTGLFTELFSAEEKPKYYFKLLIGVIILNLVLNYILIKYLSIYSLVASITGAAIATLISWVVYSICLGILTKKKLGIKTNLIVCIKPLISSLVMVGLILLLKNSFKDITLLNGVILVISGIIVYFVSLFLIKGINKEDYILIELIKSKFNKRV